MMSQRQSDVVVNFGVYSCEPDGGEISSNSWACSEVAPMEGSLALYYPRQGYHNVSANRGRRVIRYLKDCSPFIADKGRLSARR